MQVQIKEIQPFDIVGYASRHRLPGVGKISDIPGYWEKINLEYGAALTTLHDTYRQSRHCEVAVCFDLDERQACFTYMLGVGVDGAGCRRPAAPGNLPPPHTRRPICGLYNTEGRGGPVCTVHTRHLGAGSRQLASPIGL